MQLKISTKHMGAAVVAVALLMSIVLFSYTDTVRKLNIYTHQDCGMPDDICPAKNDVPIAAVAGFTLDAVLLILGLLLVFYDKQISETAIAVKKKFSFNVKSLQADEKKVFEMLSNGDGGEFQSSLVEKSGMSKVSVSRILDRLEAKGLIERRRRGMSNFVILKGVAE
ncbi:MAG TPA: MarR family transcriptional regulator [archaeon]|nr:MarR family transcriptional regulator [archaeon]